MKMVRILKIGDEYSVETQYGTKMKKNFVVMESSTGEEMDVGYFLKKDNPVVEVGMDVMMDLQKSGKYINCKKMELVEDSFPPEEEPHEEPLPKHPTTKQKEAVLKSNPAEPLRDALDEGKWLSYVARVNALVDIFSKAKLTNCDTALAGSVLGLRELMGFETKKKW